MAVEVIKIAIRFNAELVVSLAMYELDVEIIRCQVKYAVVENDIEFLSIVHHPNTRMSVLRPHLITWSASE